MSASGPSGPLVFVLNMHIDMNDLYIYRIMYFSDNLCIMRITI